MLFCSCRGCWHVLCCAVTADALPLPIHLIYEVFSPPSPRLSQRTLGAAVSILPTSVQFEVQFALKSHFPPSLSPSDPVSCSSILLLGLPFALQPNLHLPPSTYHNPREREHSIHASTPAPPTTRCVVTFSPAATHSSPPPRSLSSSTAAQRITPQ